MKKLLRSKDNKVICGVCAGIATYFNIDPTVIRVLWAVLALCSLGVAAIAYIICAVIIPVDDGTSIM
ncbi:MAG: PspC domain-containing protein [Oscillospiraceae bacterium]